MFLQILESKNYGRPIETGNIYFVRPLGGSYGDENGLSYANAWDGFTNIDWTVFDAGDTLYICGTHNERCYLDMSGLEGKHSFVRGDFATESGILDGLDTVSHLMYSENNDYVEYHGLVIKNATTACFETDGGNHWVYDCEITDSGDQNVELRNGANTRIYDTLIARGADDGISIHSDGIAYCERVTFEDAVVNHIQSAGGEV